MIYSDVLYSKKLNDNLYEVAIHFPLKPLPGQFISLIIPSAKEIPLSITDYYQEILKLHLSEKIFNIIKEKRRILVKGPLGKPLNLKVSSILGIAYKDLFYDILYILREAKRSGLKVRVNCIDCDTNEFLKASENEKFDLTIASVPQDLLNKVPKGSLVYVRWIKMNCMLGVCGVCELKDKLVCTDGPLLKVEEVVD